MLEMDGPRGLGWRQHLREIQCSYLDIGGGGGVAAALASAMAPVLVAAHLLPRLPLELKHGISR